MKKIYFVIILLTFCGSVFGQLTQFRMIGSGTWATVNDSTFSSTVTIQADLTANGFLPTGIVDSMKVFTQTGQRYRISSVSNKTFSSADLVVVESGGNWGSPVGQVLIYENRGRSSVPSIPFSATGATAKMQEAVDTYNSSFDGDVTTAQLADSTAAIRADLGGSGADNLGNHTATTTLNIGTNWISQNTDLDGISISGNDVIIKSFPTATTELKISSTSGNAVLSAEDSDSDIKLNFNTASDYASFQFNSIVNWRFFEDYQTIIPATSNPAYTPSTAYFYLWPVRPSGVGSGVLRYQDGTGTIKTVATVDQTGNAFGIQVSIEGGLTEALAAVTATRKTILVDEVVTLSGNITVPDSVDLFFVDGGFINLDNDTLTLNGGLNAPYRQIFDASSGGVITGNTFTRTWYSEWFGAKSNDGLYDSEALDYTGKTIRNIGGGTFELLAGTYNIDTAASVYSNTLLKGQGIGVTIIEAPTDTLEVRYQLRGEQRRLYAFLVGEYGGGDVENVTAQDITFLMHDTQIGNAADENNSWPTNWGTQPIGAHLWDEFTSASTGKASKLLFQRLEVRDFNAWQPVLRDAGGQIPGVTIGVEYNTDITIQDCILDSTANKAIEFQEISGGFIRGNTIRNSASAIQLINFCDRVQIYDNYTEFENGGIITSSEISDCEIRDNYIKYTGTATSTNNDPFLACIGLKQEEEQPVFTTSGLRVEGNTFDCTLNTQDSFYSVTIFSSADTAIFQDIQFIGNKHIRGKVGLFNQRHSDGDFITRIRNTSFVNEIDISLVSDYNVKDSIYDISFRNNDFREDIDTVIIRGNEFQFLNNNMRKLRFEFATESDTLNAFAYNIVNDTANIVEKAKHYNQFNIVPGLVFEVDTTPPPAVSWIAEWTGDLGVTSAADVGAGVDTLISWADQTGNGHTLVPIPESGTRGTIYNSGTLNGYRYITFSPTAGKTKVLETIDSISYGDSWSIFMLARPNQAVIYPVDIESDNSNVTNLRIYNSTRSEDIGGVIKGVNVDKIDAGGTDTWAFYNWNRASNLVTLTYNNNTFGVQDITTTASEELIKTNIGGRWWPPTREETDAFDLIHVIIFDRSATPTERNAIKATWETKYGLTF